MLSGIALEETEKFWGLSSSSHFWHCCTACLGLACWEFVPMCLPFIWCVLTCKTWGQLPPLHIAWCQGVQTHVP